MKRPAAPVAPGFLKVSPLTMALAYAPRELHGQAIPEEVRWLYGHPVLWLRALVVMDREVQTHVAKDRRAVAPLRPNNGEAPSSEFLAARRAFEEAQVGRLHFTQKLDRRTEEVKALLGSQALVARMTTGDLFELMIEFEQAAREGDMVAVMAKSRFIVRKLKADMEAGR